MNTLEASIAALHTLDYETIVSLAFMFNFTDARRLANIGGLVTANKVCIKAAIASESDGARTRASGEGGRGGWAVGSGGGGGSSQNSRRDKGRSRSTSSRGPATPSSSSPRSSARGGGGGGGKGGLQPISEWSRGFSLDAVNIDQVASVHLSRHGWREHVTAGVFLEMGFSTKLPPGRRGGGREGRQGPPIAPRAVCCPRR